MCIDPRECRSLVCLTHWDQATVSVAYGMSEARTGGLEDRSGRWEWSRYWRVLCRLLWFSMQWAMTVVNRSMTLSNLLHRVAMGTCMEDWAKVLAYCRRARQKEMGEERRCYGEEEG